MSDHTLRESILTFLKLTKTRSAEIRRHCNEKWCAKLKRLRGKRLEACLRYVVWWAPLRVIATAYSRGLLNGRIVLMCVFKELQRRGLEETPCARGIDDEIRSK